MTTTERTEYSKAVSTLRDWKTTAVIRPHYKISHTAADKLIKRIVDTTSATAVWYTLEQDYDTNLNHLHLLLDAKMTKESLPYSSYAEPIDSPEAITGYINKHINKKNSHHNLYF